MFLKSQDYCVIVMLHKSLQIGKLYVVSGQKQNIETDYYLLLVHLYYRNK